MIQPCFHTAGKEEIYFFSLNYRGKALNFYWKTILVADLLYIGQNVANKVKYGVEKI